jgi:hypothetical protein
VTLAASLALMAVAGAAAGVLVGLIGVGGGIIYAPVLLVALGAAGVADPVLTPLVAGTSLLCVLLASLAGARAQWQRGAIDVGLAARVGLYAAVPVALTTALVSTQPWYRERTFAGVLGLVLVATVARLLLKREAPADEPPRPIAATPARLAATGVSAGVLSALAGVGGGVVLVPALHGLVRLPFKVATATSTAAIVPVALAGVLSYVAAGWGAAVPAGALGYVDVPRALALALPAMLTARVGVALAHRLPARTVRLAFAAFAALVAARLLLHAFGG